MWRLPCALAETALLKFPALNKVEPLLLWLQQQGLDCFQGTLSKNSSCLCLSPPAASGGAAQLTFLPHPALPAKPASCGTCFPTSAQGDKPGCYNSRSTLTRFPSAWKGLDGRRSSPCAGIPATTGLEHPLKGVSWMEGCWVQNYPGRAGNPHPWVPSAFPAPAVPHIPSFRGLQRGV